MKRLIKIGLLCLLFITTTAGAPPYLTGNPHNIGTTAEIDDQGFDFDELMLISYSESHDWMFALTAGVGNAKTYKDLATFAFTTESSVNTSLINHYALYHHRYPDPLPTFIEVGLIIRPELVNTHHPVSPVPENETYAMMVAGLGMLGYMSRRTKRRVNKTYGNKLRDVV